MITELTQTTGILKQKFTLENDRVIVEKKTFTSIEKYDVKLDYLGSQLFYKADNTLGAKIFRAFCIVMILLITTGYFLGETNVGTFVVGNGLWLIVLCIIHLTRTRDDIHLIGGQSQLIFFRIVPDEKTVMDFIDAVREQTKQYTKEKYLTHFSAMSNEEFYARLGWLRDREIISLSEYVDYKEQFEMHKLL